MFSDFTIVNVRWQKPNARSLQDEGLNQYQQLSPIITSITHYTGKVHEVHNWKVSMYVTEQVMKIMIELMNL